MMLRPTTGELLGRISASLRTSVLPELKPGTAQRQLKASLYALDRLTLSWDLLPDYVAQDNADIRRTLGMAIEAVAKRNVGAASEMAGRLAAIEAGTEKKVDVAGIVDPSLAAAVSANLSLQDLLAAFDQWLRTSGDVAADLRAEQIAALESLYNRMNRRELRAWAVEAEIA